MFGGQSSLLLAPSSWGGCGEWCGLGYLFAGDSFDRQERCWNCSRRRCLKLEDRLLECPQQMVIVRKSWASFSETHFSILNEVLVSLKLNALPWLASVWQKARHWDTKEEPISAVIFSCSSDLCAVTATFKNTGKKQTLSQMYISLKETSQPPSPLLKETVNIDHVKCGAAL